MVHPADGFDTKVAEPFTRVLQTTGGHEILEVVSQLDNSQAQVVEGLQVVRIGADANRILDIQQDAGFPSAFAMWMSATRCTGMT